MGAESMVTFPSLFYRRNKNKTFKQHCEKEGKWNNRALKVRERKKETLKYPSKVQYFNKCQSGLKNMVNS